MGRSVRTPGLDTKRLENKLSNIDDEGNYNESKFPDYSIEWNKLNQAVYDINQITITLSDKASKTIATTSTSGLMSNTDKSKLDGIAANANNYSHPTGDGNLHVPATGTTNRGKVLTAGATAGSLSWTSIPAAPVSSVAGKTGVVTLVKGDVGLGNVDNTADSAKAVLSATKLATARTLTLTGDVSGSVSFDGSSNVNITASVQDNSHLHTIDNITGLRLELDSKLEEETNTSLVKVGNELRYTNEQGITQTVDLSVYLDATNLSRIVSGTYDVNTNSLVFTRDDSSTFSVDASMFFDDTNLVTSVADRTGAITLTKSDVGLNNVDNTSDLNKPISTSVSTALSNKVDKITGKGLSTEDYTTVEKNKLANIQSNANLYTDEQAQDAINNALISGTHSGIGFNYNDVSNSLSLTNTDTGSLALTDHLNQSHPHSQYIKTVNGVSADSNGDIAINAGSSVSVARLTTTQVSNNTTEQILNGFTFTIPPGKTATINCIMIFSSAAISTGAFLGVRVSNAAGSNGDVIGSWQAYVNVTSAQANSGLADGDVLIVTPGTTSSSGRGVTGTASTAGNNSSRLLLLLSNTSTNANSEASIVFRSETTTAVTAQIGTIATCILS